MQYHARGAHVTKLNPAWVWPPSAVEEEAPPEPELPQMPDGVIAFWPEDKATTSFGWPIASGEDAVGQTFTPMESYPVHSAQFSLKKTNVPTGDLVAELHYVMANTPATGSVPYAVSAPVPVDSIGDTPALYEFLFPEGSELIRGTNNAIVLALYGTHDSANAIGFSQTQGPTAKHPGRTVRRMLDGSWVSNALMDTVFYLYHSPPP
jgi:hypothetical protein